MEILEGEEAVDEAYEGFVDGISLATVGAWTSGIVVTLPCLEWPPRADGGRDESAFPTLRRF